MSINITKQTAEAAYALLLGGVLGVLYDFLGMYRRAAVTLKSSTVNAGRINVLNGKRGRRLSTFTSTLLFDLLFCVLSGAGFFMLGYGPGGGKLRLFLLLFIAAGAALYFKFFSRFIRKLLELLTYAVVRIFRLLIINPIRWVIKIHKKFTNSAKNNLQLSKKRFTIKRNYVIRFQGDGTK
jgi:hypothetical protein